MFNCLTHKEKGQSNDYCLRGLNQVGFWKAPYSSFNGDKSSLIKEGTDWPILKSIPLYLLPVIIERYALAKTRNWHLILTMFVFDAVVRSIWRGKVSYKLMSFQREVESWDFEWSFKKLMCLYWFQAVVGDCICFHHFSDKPHQLCRQLETFQL